VKLIKRAHLTQKYFDFLTNLSIGFAVKGIG